MSVEVFDLTRIQAEQQARADRREKLREAFADIYTIVVNTGTHTKANAAVSIAAALGNARFSLGEGEVFIQPSQKEEPKHFQAKKVARFKASTARQEYVEEKMGDQLFTFDQLAKILFLGADINAFEADLKQSHKLAREFPVTLPDSEFAKLRAKLYKEYVHPPNGVVRKIWDISSSMLNGKDYGFTDLIEVIAKPLDPELLEMYLSMAVADGKILGSNTHLAAFEMLCASGKITTIARLPGELAAKGYTFADFRQSPKKEEMAAIIASLNNNQPVHIA